MSLLIPVDGGVETLEILYEELPDAKDLQGILQQESVPLKVWMEAALAYYRTGRGEGLQTLLQQFGADSFEASSSNDKVALIAVLGTLAAYSAKCALELPLQHTGGSTYADAYSKLLGESLSHTNKALRIDGQDRYAHMVKAISLLYRKETTKAMQTIEEIIRKVEASGQAPFLPALIGKACVLCWENKYQQALEQFTVVLQLNPNVDASVRVAIARCYFALKKLDLADRALSSIFDHNPTDGVLLEAIMDLAIIAWNSGDEQRAVDYATKVFKANEKNARALNLLAEQFFKQQQYQQATNYATRAVKATSIKKVRAWGIYILAKTKHALGKFTSAENLYKNAEVNWSDFHLAQFGQGQLFLHHNNRDQANKAFLKVLKKVPNDVATLKYLATLHTSRGSYKGDLQAIKYADKVIGSYNGLNDVLELASILQRQRPEDALGKYQEALILHTKADPPLPPAYEVHNNMGVLLHMLGRYQESEASFSRSFRGISLDETKDKNEAAFSVSDSLSSPESLKTLLIPNNLTAFFNVGRLFEDSGKGNIAEKIYMAIIKQYPTYRDCYARLGLMTQGSDPKVSDGWFKQLEQLGGEEGKIDSTMLISSSLMERGLFPAAHQKLLEVTSVQKSHALANLHLGNVYLSGRSQSEERTLRYALEFYSAALKADPTNFYAVNGIAICLKKLGKDAEALDYFNKVTEARSNYPDAFINLGHVNMEKHLYSTASRLYQKAVEFCNDNNPNLADYYVYLSHSHFKVGEYVKATEAIKKSLSLRPDHSDTLYNYALLLQTQANQLYHLPTPNSVQLKEAASFYQEAATGFVKLRGVKESQKKVMFSETKRVRFEKICEQNASLAFTKAEKREKFEVDRDADMAAKRVIAVELLEKKKEQQEAERLKEAAKKEASRTKAEEDAKRLQEVAQKFEAAKELAATAKSRRRASTPKVRDPNTPKKKREKKPKEPKKKKTKKKKGRTFDDLEFSDSDDAEFDPEKADKKRAEEEEAEGEMSSSSEEASFDGSVSGEEEGGEEEPEKKQKTQKKRKLVSGGDGPGSFKRLRRSKPSEEPASDHLLSSDDLELSDDADAAPTGATPKNTQESANGDAMEVDEESPAKVVDAGNGDLLSDDEELFDA
eukprot:TRINITY_DN5595_c0_g1_i1.p1 TRINITY_DN5595_c0_g1~~TRINITY_DN5595_c0_g1_i1.p1  ORF type:complete len:1125 (-),score=318.58 TRINITY_DN5595_c0_g1_i1:81-3455(-)